MSQGQELSFRLRYSLTDPDERRWLIVPLSIGQDHILEMLPSLFAARSTINRRAFRDLLGKGQVVSSGPTIMLRDVRIVGQSVPDLTVRVGSAASLLRVDGILGLDFFQQFSLITLEPQTWRVTLVGH